MHSCEYGMQQPQPHISCKPASDHMRAVLQEQLKHDVAGLQKQLASQKRGFEEEAKAHEQLQEEHERELPHLKRDIKHKLVGLQPQRLLFNLLMLLKHLRKLMMKEVLDAQMEQEFAVTQHARQEERKDKSMPCFGGQNASLMRQQLRDSCNIDPAGHCLVLVAADLPSASQQCSMSIFPTCIATRCNQSPAVSPSDQVMLTDMATEAACALAILLACCQLLLPCKVSAAADVCNIAQHARGENIFKQVQLMLPCEVTAAAAV